MAYHLKSLQMTLASLMMPLLSRLGDKTCAGIKLFFPQRDNTLSNKVPISTPCPAVKKQALATQLGGGVRGAPSWSAELFYYEKTLEVKFC